MTARWPYRVVSAAAEVAGDLEKVLNRLDADGWDVAYIVPGGRFGGGGARLEVVARDRLPEHARAKRDADPAGRFGEEP